MFFNISLCGIQRHMIDYSETQIKFHGENYAEISRIRIVSAEFNPKLPDVENFMRMLHIENSFL